ncbi:hypothetical protein D3C86_1920460 [compost metagenome]
MAFKTKAEHATQSSIIDAAVVFFVTVEIARFGRQAPIIRQPQRVVQLHILLVVIVLQLGVIVSSTETWAEVIGETGIVEPFAGCAGRQPAAFGKGQHGHVLITR